MSSLDLRPPTGERLSRSNTMTRRERAHACWLALRLGWDLNPRNWFYCTDTDRVLVQFKEGGTCTWSKVRFEADETIALIEERFGVGVRRQVEALV